MRSSRSSRSFRRIKVTKKWTIKKLKFNLYKISIKSLILCLLSQHLHNPSAHSTKLSFSSKWRCARPALSAETRASTSCCAGTVSAAAPRTTATSCTLRCACKAQNAVPRVAVICMSAVQWLTIRSICRASTVPSAGTVYSTQCCAGTGQHAALRTATTFTPCCAGTRQNAETRAATSGMSSRYQITKTKKLIY